MKKNKDNNKPLNPEILREKREKAKSDNLYDEEIPLTLFPGSFIGGVASANDSTGLMQNIAVTPDMIDAYDELYSYRKKTPDVTRE